MAGTAGTSLVAELDAIGISGPFAKSFIQEYHEFVQNCTARNPLMRPRIGQYIHRLKERNIHG